MSSSLCELHWCEWVCPCSVPACNSCCCPVCAGFTARACSWVLMWTCQHWRPAALATQGPTWPPWPGRQQCTHSQQQRQHCCSHKVRVRGVRWEGVPAGGRSIVGWQWWCMLPGPPDHLGAECVTSERQMLCVAVLLQVAISRQQQQQQQWTAWHHPRISNTLAW